MKKNSKPTIAIISTYPPRACGIATFTSDLYTYFQKMYSPNIAFKIIAINANRKEKEVYPNEVIGEVIEDDAESYRTAAQKLNKDENIKLINIQHEYGLFGKSWGKSLIALLEKLEKPVVVTMHTVIPNPTKELKECTQSIASFASGITVATQGSKETLINEYGVHADKIRVIPHGIHPMVFTTPEAFKSKLKLKGKTVLSTFGLLSPNKGVEYVIDSLPEIITKHPDVIYLIIGQTHPNILKKEGEKYRKSLEARVEKLKLNGHVRFYNNFYTTPEILNFLKATDIYISTSLDPNQAVSGTLSYALGSGRTVVSTKFKYAQELVTEDVGRLVDFKSPSEFSKVINELLTDQQELSFMREAAYNSTRKMTWNNVAIMYMRTFTRHCEDLVPDSVNLPKVNFKFLRKTTDDFGMLQFSKLNMPDPDHGYTLDDNGRALIAVGRFYSKKPKQYLEKLMEIYLNFIEYVQLESGEFVNYVNYDRTFNDERHRNENLEDANARAIWSLGETISNREIPHHLREKAKKILAKRVAFGMDFKFLRSKAFVILGLSSYLEVMPDEVLLKKVKEYSSDLVESYKKHRTDNWRWFENELTYANAVLPHSLLCAFLTTNEKEYFDIAEESMIFLLKQTLKGPMYEAVGQNGWYKKGGTKAEFDQQPEDPASTVLALSAFYDATQDPAYERFRSLTFYWFLGNNTLGVSLYDKSSGASYDGLRPDGVNLNQGAESTVSYLLARLAVGNGIS